MQGIGAGKYFRDLAPPGSLPRRGASVDRQVVSRDVVRGRRCRREATGRLQDNEMPVLIGRMENGLGEFRGVIEQFRTASAARGEQWIKDVHRNGPDPG